MPLQGPIPPSTSTQTQRVLHTPPQMRLPRHTQARIPLIWRRQHPQRHATDSRKLRLCSPLLRTSPRNRQPATTRVPLPRILMPAACTLRRTQEILDLQDPPTRLQVLLRTGRASRTGQTHSTPISQAAAARCTRQDSRTRQAPSTPISRAAAARCTHHANRSMLAPSARTSLVGIPA